jgi:DDE superfamily endonuclease
MPQEAGMMLMLLNQYTYEKLCTQTPDGYYLVTDTAFPWGTAQIAGQICAPLKAGQRLCGSEEEIQEKMAYNCELLSFCQTAEWGNQHLQGTFGRLHVPLEIDNAEQHGDLLELCVCLGNL